MQPSHMIRGTAGKVGWNLVGLVVPVVVAIMAIPSLLGNLGAERYGLLALAWGVVSLFEILDFGFNRAVARAVAIAHGLGEHARAQALRVAGERQAWRRGTLGGLAFGGLMLAGGYLLIPAESIPLHERWAAALALSVTAPLQVVLMARRSSTEAMLNFRAVNLARMLTTSLDVILPCVVSSITQRLDLIILSLIGSKMISVLVFGLVVKSKALPIERGATINEDELQGLAYDGKHVAISAALAPVFLHSDRLLVGMFFSASAISTYTVAADTIKRISNLTSAITSVIFPSLSAMVAVGDERRHLAFRRILGLMVIASGVAFGVLAAVMPQIADIWIGHHAQDLSTTIRVAQWLCLGLWFRVVSSMNFAWLHAHRQFAAVARLQILQVLPFMCLSVALLLLAGPQGAAIAWTVREGADALMLYLRARKS